MRVHFLAFIFLVVSFTVCFGQQVKTIHLNSPYTDVKITDHHFEGIVLTLNFGEIELTKKQTNKGTFHYLEIPNLIKTFKEGYPCIPVYSGLVEIPQDAEVQIDILSYDEEIIDLPKRGINEKLYPAQPSLNIQTNPSDVELKFNENVYMQDQYFPTKPYEIEYRGMMRHTRLARIELHPVEYNPLKNQLKIFEVSI